MMKALTLIAGSETSEGEVPRTSTGGSPTYQQNIASIPFVGRPVIKMNRRRNKTV
jgi:hypothetical protein